MKFSMFQKLGRGKLSLGGNLSLVVTILLASVSIYACGSSSSGGDTPKAPQLHLSEALHSFDNVTIGNTGTDNWTIVIQNIGNVTATNLSLKGLTDNFTIVANNITPPIADCVDNQSLAPFEECALGFVSSPKVWTLGKGVAGAAPHVDNITVKASNIPDAKQPYFNLEAYGVIQYHIDNVTNPANPTTVSVNNVENFGNMTTPDNKTIFTYRFYNDNLTGAINGIGGQDYVAPYFIDYNNKAFQILDNSTCGNFNIANGGIKRFLTLAPKGQTMVLDGVTYTDNCTLNVAFSEASYYSNNWLGSPIDAGVNSADIKLYRSFQPTPGAWPVTIEDTLMKTTGVAKLDNFTIYDNTSGTNPGTPVALGGSVGPTNKTDNLSFGLYNARGIAQSVWVELIGDGVADNFTLGGWGASGSMAGWCGIVSTKAVSLTPGNGSTFTSRIPPSSYTNKSNCRFTIEGKATGATGATAKLRIHGTYAPNGLDYFTITLP